MDVIFVDTSFLIAWYNTDDINHEKAKSFIEDLRTGKKAVVRLILTDYVFDETVTMVLKRTRSKHKAVRLGSSILASPTIKMIDVTPEIFARAWEMFKTYEDKEWSFTDCVSFVIMRQLDIRVAAAFDDHFNQAGFTLIG